MDEHSDKTNFKVKILNGVRELVARAAITEDTGGYLGTEGDRYPTCALYGCIKNHIVFNINERLFKEIKAIKTIGNKYKELAICASARKLIATPEMVSVIFELKEGLDCVLGLLSCRLSDTQPSTFDGECFMNARNKELVKNIYDLNFKYDPISVDGMVINNGEGQERDFEGRKDKSDFLLAKLSKASLTEIFDVPCWVNFKSMLRKSLCDDSERIFSHALKLHARFLLSSSNVGMFESFLNLKVSFLDQYQKSKYKRDLPNFNEGITFSKLPHMRLLRTMHLMIEFFRDGSKNYIRLPIKLIEEIVGSMIDLIAFLPDDSTVVYPYHLLSVLDPKARWIKMCFYYTCVRKITLNKLSKSTKLITYIKKISLSWLKSLDANNIPNLESDFSQLVDGRHIDFATFSHSMHLYIYLMSCDEGRNIIWSVDGGVTSQEILRNIVTYLDNSPTLSQTAMLLLMLLNRLLTSSDNSILSNILLNILFVNPLFGTCQETTHNFDSKSYQMINPFVINLISTMLKSKIGRDRFILPQKYNFGGENIEMSPARMFLHYTCNFLKKLPCDESLFLKRLLRSCALLSLSPKGLIEIEESNLITILAILYRQLKGQNHIDTIQSMSPYINFISEENCLVDLVTTCLISLTANSGRVWWIEKEGVLLPILNDCYKRPVIQWGSCWFQKLVLSSTLMTGGFEALVGEQIQRIPLANLWKSWSLNGNVGLLPGKGREENSQHEINNLFCLCSTLRGVKAMLVEQEGSEETLTEGIVNLPLTLQEVLEVTLGLSQDPSENGVSLQNEMLVFGLRLLRFMMSSLDTNLLLQNKFIVQEHVMKIHNKNMLEEKGELIVDEITIMCEQILRNSFLVDSCNERNFYVTKNTASKSPGNVQHKLVVSQRECLSREWILCGSGRQRCRSRHTPRRLKNDLVKFLGSTRHGLRDVNWLNQLRKVHRSIFIGNNSPEVKSNVLMELLEEVQKAYANIPYNSMLSKILWSEHDLYSLFPEDLLGIKLAVRYGAKLSLIQPTPLMHSNFAQILRSAYGGLNVVRDEFCGFDWFLATVFLLCCGNIDRCQLFINNFVKLQVAPFLWMTYGECLSKAESFGNNYWNDFLFLIIQQVELILSIEVPKVFSAFQSSAASVAVLIQQWMCQCFWNILDWPEIKNFLCFTIINEPDYIIYFCVALLLHLEPVILHTVSTSAEHFWERIKINPVGHFHLGNYLFFIEKLYKIHHNNVIRSISKCISDFNKTY